MINPTQLMQHVIVPVLSQLKMDSKQARLLLLETAMQESRLCHLHQAAQLGIYQMDALLHDELWRDFLKFNPISAREVRSFSIQKNANRSSPDANEMQGNLYYATAMARCHYSRVPVSIPDDVRGRAAYWKAHYSAPFKKGTVTQYVTNAKMLYRLYEDAA